MKIPKGGAAVAEAPTSATDGASSELAQQQGPTVSEKFIARIERQFTAELGSGVHWTPLQKKLAQHLYIHIDTALQALEVKRASNNYQKNNPPITWAKVNMQKLALDAVHRVNLELDALIKNHIHVIPYLNKRTGLYDVDLRIGYMGVDHCVRKFSAEPILDIRYQLVHESDKFSYGTQNGVAYVNFEQTNPFNPGPVVGGFGYISYEDPRKNRVVIVEYREFEKARKASKGVEFWGGEQTEWKDGSKVSAGYDEKFEKEMQFKTVVHRVDAKISLDPKRIHAASFAAIEAEIIGTAITQIENEAEERANRDVITMPPLQQSNTVVGEVIYTPEQLRETLGLNPDQWSYIEAQLKERGAPVTLHAFLNECAANGCESYADVSRELASLPEAQSVQPQLGAEEEPY